MMKRVSHEARKQGLVNLIRAELANAGVRPTDILVIAVSGGPDSMVLVDLLRQIGEREQLVVGHINHGLRKEADRGEELVARYCRKYKLNFATRRVDLGGKPTGIEERARELRYAALQDIARENRANWIVTAHTADDQVETVVANWLRGSAVRGLGGMKLRTGGIIRPLLSVWKKQLLAYAKKQALRYVIDESNSDLQFTRNRIRHQLLPELRKFNKQIDEQLWHSSQIWQQVDGALTDLAKQYFRKIGTNTRGKVVLSISKLRELTPLMQIEVVKLALAGDLAGLERSHFAEVLKILASPKPIVAKRRLGGKLFAGKSHDKITISQR